MHARVKLAGAPISWGVCEVPGWGLQLSPQRVFNEMQDLGLVATEAGPPGFLPADAYAARSLLRMHHLGLVGGFVTAVLHDLPTAIARLPTRAGSPACFAGSMFKPEVRKSARPFAGSQP